MLICVEFECCQFREKGDSRGRGVDRLASSLAMLVEAVVLEFLVLCISD